MQKAFTRPVACATSSSRLLHRAVSQASELGAARRSLAGYGTQQRASCKRRTPSNRFADHR